jgi:hypothetical protein
MKCEHTASRNQVHQLLPGVPFVLGAGNLATDAVIDTIDAMKITDV